MASDMLIIHTNYNPALFRYINEFMGLQCLADLTSRKIFPDGKEVTESQGAFWGVTKYLLGRDMTKFGYKDINLISVGDGRQPRTAALFALRTRWNCISVDPNLAKTDWGIERLTCYKSRIEELDLKFNSRTIIVCVHSHATLKNTLDHINAPHRDVLAIPCCVPYKLERDPDMTYVDFGIWSPKNQIKIWRNI